MKVDSRPHKGHLEKKEFIESQKKYFWENYSRFLNVNLAPLYVCLYPKNVNKA